MNQTAGQLPNRPPGSGGEGPSGPTSSPNLAPGSVLAGRYRIEQAVARGGCAIVFRGVDEMLGESVALKLLLPGGELGSPQVPAHAVAIRTEAISAMRLSHPKIVRVFNYERHPPWEFLVMEYVVGGTLKQYQQSQPERRLGALEMLRLGIDCLEALAYAHGVGVIHNDIKPSNILLGPDGSIKLCDFGLARLSSSTQKTAVVAGTPHFMSPERIRGESGDHRSDLYSMAAMLYLLGNGQPLFGTDAEALYGHLHAPVPPSRHLPVALHEVLVRALAKSPEARFESAEEMQAALLEVLEGMGGLAALPASGRRTPSPVGRRTPVPSEHKALAPPERRAGDTCEVSTSMVTQGDEKPSGAAAGESGPVSEPNQMSVRSQLAMTNIAACRLRSAYGGEFEVAPFRLDRHPVTNAQYQEFVQATGAPAPAHWLGDRPPPLVLEHPVVGVTFEEARRYAAWKGKRLPTNLEWEAAARGPEGRRFPWGDQWDPERCQGPEQGGTSTAPVGRFPGGNSPEGCVDLVGNVWEWTEPDERARPEDGYAFVMGGSYRHPCVQEGAIARTQVSAHKAYEYLGFRCAADAADDAEGEVGEGRR